MSFTSPDSGAIAPQMPARLAALREFTDSQAGPLILNQDDKGRWNLPTKLHQFEYGEDDMDESAEDDQEESSEEDEDGRILVSLSSPAYILFPTDLEELVQSIINDHWIKVKTDYCSKFLVESDVKIDEVDEC